MTGYPSNNGCGSGLLVAKTASVVGVADAADLRVALVTYATKARGGVVHTLHLAEALHAAGHSVQIVALGDPSVGFFRPTAVPHTLIAPPPPADTLEERVFQAVDALAAGLADLGPDRFDIVHVQDCIAARAAVRVRDQQVLDGSTRTPVLRTVHHVDQFTTPALVECQLRSILDPDHVVVVSEYWRARLSTDYGVDASVVTNGIDLARVLVSATVDPRGLRAQVDASDRRLLLSVGGIEPRKGSYQLLEAFAAVRAQHRVPPVLAVIGGHSFQDHAGYRERALNRAQELNLVVGRDVVLLGTVSDAELAGWYAAADVFVLPSVEEGWGLAVLEAMAAGLPVVVSDIPVFQEYLTDGHTALLAAAGDSRSLAAALQRVLTEPSLRARLASAGRRTAVRFTWDACAQQHVQIYRRVTAGAEHVAP
jgi:glycosyltransferase-like protein